MRTVGRYEILREVGRGGMAMVYLARQTDLDRFVALKELGAFHASDPSFAERFLRESRVAGSLSHPNIVTVHDYFEHDGTPFIAMEYVERGSLRPYVGRTTLAQVGGVLEGLLAGLAHAEQHGIVHRDLKPENLMVTSDGRVKIADFGIAKATTKMQTGAFLTATGTTVGTPTYMAPEQAMAQDIGPWTDLYSVGCMAFELFTGRVPFHDSEAPMAILLRHVNEPIPPVKSIEPSVDQRVSDWVEKLLVKDPKQRARSANDAWDEFEEIVIGLLGPRWRREARLMQSTEQVDTPKPLTPAPFEGTSAEPAASGEFESFAWGQPGAPDTGGAPAPPPGPFTPPPQPAMPTPPEPQVGPPTPPPTPAAPAPAPTEDDDFVTFGAPAPPPPTDALVPPPAEAPPEDSPRHETVPRADDEPPVAPADDAPATPAAGAPAVTPAEDPPAVAPDDTSPSKRAGFETYNPPPPPRPPTEEPPSEQVAAPLPPVKAPPQEPPAPPPAPPVREPEPVAAEPELAPTVRPRSLPEETAPAAPPAEKRGIKPFPIVLAVGAVLAAVVGFLIGGSGRDDGGGGAPTAPAANASMRLNVPSDWSRLPTAPEIPGIGIADPVAYAAEPGGETVVFGSVPEAADNSTLLSEDLIAAAGTNLIPAPGEAPQGREAVVIGPSDLEAYRYENVRLEGLDRPVTLYAVPTTEGVATLACLAGPDGAPSCAAIADTVELSGGEPFAVGPNADYAETLSRVSDNLAKAVDKPLAALGRARTPSAQADASRDLRAAYRKAAQTLRGQELSPADRKANASFVGALQATAEAYGAAATAADNNNKAAYRRADRALDRATRQGSAAIEGLQAAGYEIES